MFYAFFCQLRELLVFTVVWRLNDLDCNKKNIHTDYITVLCDGLIVPLLYVRKSDGEEENIKCLAHIVLSVRKSVYCAPIYLVTATWRAFFYSFRLFSFQVDCITLSNIEITINLFISISGSKRRNGTNKNIVK